MGGMQSQSMEVLKYFEKEWQYIQTNPQGVKIFRNRDNDKEAEAHNVAIDPRQNISKEYDIYNYRRTQDNALVSVYAVNNLKDKSPHLCGNRDVLKVMVEHIPVRGSQLSHLAFKEGLYVLSEAIRGYQDCYSKVGYFQVNDQMIGLNKAGNLKVWLNENFAQNHPANQKPILQITTANQLRANSEKEQEAMVKEVVAMVSPKCKQLFPSDFAQLIKKQSNFISAYQAIEDYCKINQIEVPDRIILGKNNSERIATNLEERLLTKINSIPNYASVEPVEKIGSSDFSFNHQQPKVKLKSHERDTIINNLSTSEKYNHNSHIPVTYQSQTPYQPNISWNNRQQSPVKANPHQSLYTQPLQSNNTYERQIIQNQFHRVPLKPNSPQPSYRGSSPAISPRGVNFNYHNAPRNTSINRTNFVTSTRY